MEQNEEKIVGKIIHHNLSVEWMRYNMFSSKNIYKNIPMLIFRLDTSNRAKEIDDLQKCVSGFEGNDLWKVFRDPLSRKGNYLLTIAIVEKIREECRDKDIVYDEKNYLGEDKYKSCCEQAVEDIPLLARHINEYFSDKIN